MTAQVAAVHLQVLSGPVAMPLMHEREAYAAAYTQRLCIDRAERQAADVGRALDLKLIERSTHSQVCSFCLAHRRGVCPRRREVERAVRSLYRRFGRALLALEGV